MKKRVTMYVDEKLYKQFQIQSIMLNKSVSERIDEFMKKELKDRKEN